MERAGTTLLRVGDWCVNPTTGEMTRGGEAARLEVRALRLLLCLANRAGEVVSIDALLDEAWAGVTVSQDSVYQAVASLRRQLGDEAKEPKYIETVPRLGYRMVAKVGPWEVEMAGTGGLGTNGPGAMKMVGTEGTVGGRLRSRKYVVLAGSTVCLVALLIVMLSGRTSSREPAAAAAAPPLQSVAVVPFLDLTPGMQNEEFADGITEELIDKLSKIPELHVPAATASFYFKGKQVAPMEIAKRLGVTYLLDGSVRKSGKMVRVAARLVRADNGYVMWTENYDRPFDDLLMVQDDIAGEVTKALKANIAGGHGQG